jgi:hypothetical protein
MPIHHLQSATLLRLFIRPSMQLRTDDKEKLAKMPTGYRLLIPPCNAMAFHSALYFTLHFIAPCRSVPNFQIATSK